MHRYCNWLFCHWKWYKFLGDIDTVQQMFLCISKIRLKTWLSGIPFYTSFKIAITFSRLHLWVFYNSQMTHGRTLWIYFPLCSMSLGASSHPLCWFFFFFFSLNLLDLPNFSVYLSFISVPFPFCLSTNFTYMIMTSYICIQPHLWAVSIFIVAYYFTAIAIVSWTQTLFCCSYNM